MNEKWAWTAWMQLVSTQWGLMGLGDCLLRLSVIACLSVVVAGHD